MLSVLRWERTCFKKYKDRQQFKVGRLQNHINGKNKANKLVINFSYTNSDFKVFRAIEEQVAINLRSQQQKINEYDDILVFNVFISEFVTIILSPVISAYSQPRTTPLTQRVNLIFPLPPNCL